MTAFELLVAPAVEDDLPVGSSRLGGRPDLPPGEPWPARHGRPLSFVAQVDLATVQTGGMLPTAGLLSYFYDAVDQPWGFEEGDDDGTVLRWTPAGTPLERRDFPDDLDGDGRFEPARISVAPAGDEPVTHRLLGTPDEIQSELDDEGTLILQVGSDDAAGTMWGDGGSLYVFLSPDALARHEWSAAHTVLQCY